MKKMERKKSDKSEKKELAKEKKMEPKESHIGKLRRKAGSKK